MTYAQAVQWLFDAVPNFQRDGGTKDYKIGLEGPLTLWEELNFPGKTTFSSTTWFDEGSIF